MAFFFYNALSSELVFEGNWIFRMIYILTPGELAGRTESFYDTKIPSLGNAKGELLQHPNINHVAEGDQDSCPMDPQKLHWRVFRVKVSILSPMGN